MFGYLTTAFGLTVYCCLGPSMLLSLLIAPLLMRFTRPGASNENSSGGDRRNPITAAVAFTRFFLVSMIVLAMGSIIMWMGLLAFTGTEGVLEFAAQNSSVERETLEDIVEPASTVDAERE